MKEIILCKKDVHKAKCRSSTEESMIRCKSMKNKAKLAVEK